MWVWGCSSVASMKSCVSSMVLNETGHDSTCLQAPSLGLRARGSAVQGQPWLQSDSWRTAWTVSVTQGFVDFVVLKSKEGAEEMAPWLVGLDVLLEDQSSHHQHQAVHNLL